MQVADLLGYILNFSFVNTCLTCNQGISLHSEKLEAHRRKRLDFPVPVEKHLMFFSQGISPRVVLAKILLVYPQNPAVWDEAELEGVAFSDKLGPSLMSRSKAL